MRDNRTGKRNLIALGLGCSASVALLTLFIVLKLCDSAALELPTQWLIVALVPVVLGLVVGGYVREVKAGDYGVDFVPSELANAQRIDDHGAPSGGARAVSSESWQMQRAKEYERTHGYMLAHIYRPSNELGQKFDISIFIVRHQKGTSTPPQENLDELESAEFFFGDSWGNKVFSVEGVNGFFGVRTHAWGTFLACCRISFKDKRPPVVLFRYIDFSMAR